MCNNACLNFGIDQLHEADVKGKRVLEVGAYNVNGSLRGYCLGFGPAEYIGVDLKEGPAVDRIVNANDLIKEFGKNSFDLVLSTEMLEHVEDWKLVITNLKGVTKPGGVILLTTRSQGFPYHEYPGDYWRYEVSDMQKIFSDFEDATIITDPYEPGVFVRATKPRRWKPLDLNGIILYSMQNGGGYR
jgi:SAM-dependent methyltransferase